METIVTVLVNYLKAWTKKIATSMNFTYFLFILCAYLSSQSESRFCSDDILKLCRRMMGKELDGLSLKELQQLENQLSDGMQSVKDKKVLRSNTNSGVIGCINLRCHLLNPYKIFYSFPVYGQTQTLLYSKFMHFDIKKNFFWKKNEKELWHDKAHINLNNCIATV